MHFHFAIASQVIQAQANYHRPVRAHRNLIASLPLSQTKAKKLASSFSLTTSRGTYVVGPAALSKGIKKYRDVFFICICGHCSPGYKSFRKKLPRKRV